MELRQSPEWGKFLEKLGWQTAVVDGCAVRIKKMGPLGSVIKIQRPEKLPLGKIEELAKRHRALFVKIEPLDNSQLSILNSQLFELDSWPLTPPRTAIIDLAPTEAGLWKSFSKDTRQTLKRVSAQGGSLPEDATHQALQAGASGGESEKLKVQSYQFSEINGENEGALKDFYRIFRETAKRGNFWTPPYPEFLAKVKAFGPEARLFLVKDNHSLLLSGCLTLNHEKTIYYHHAASTNEGQHREAPYLALWQVIVEARKRGDEKLDLEGIFDPRFKFMNTKAWHNFSVFKLKWGGEVFEYPGAYTKVYNPLVRILFFLERFLS